MRLAHLVLAPRFGTSCASHRPLHTAFTSMHTLRAAKQAAFAMDAAGGSVAAAASAPPGHTAALVWFRPGDLRLADHEPLHSAACLVQQQPSHKQQQQVPSPLLLPFACGRRRQPPRHPSLGPAPPQAAAGGRSQRARVPAPAAQRPAVAGRLARSAGGAAGGAGSGRRRHAPEPAPLSAARRALRAPGGCCGGRLQHRRRAARCARL